MDLNDGKRMFGDIKSKLGFGRKDDYEEFYDDYEEYDEEDYGEYGYDESYGRSSSSRYDPYDSVTTREVGSRSTGRSSMPRLVSIDDVRARTQVPSLSDRDGDRAGSASGRRSSGSNSFRTMVDSSLPPQMTPEGTAAASAAASAAHSARSEGLNSLFEPTTSAPAADERPAAPRSFGAAAAARTTPSRTLKVIKPMAYNDAEAISTALKLGDAVVLCLTGTPDALAKRILDFSFGVASALDANVESVGNKVFALTRIHELSEGERSYLRSQGLA